MNTEKNDPVPTVVGPICPIPLTHSDRVLMGHGSGGKMMNDLIRSTFLPPLENPTLQAADDAGVVQANAVTRLAISTDAHVVSPLFFPGGDIGKLAVCGTVNDVAMMGAVPRFITASFILEEGLEITILEMILQSMKESAEEAGVIIVAGDTKVVQKGKADGLYITTSGIGTIREGVDIRGANARPGDLVILSGTMGDHGIAVLSERGELGLESNIRSDIAPLNHLVQMMLEVSAEIHVLRDPTRGGVASTLNEISNQSGVGIIINESVLPVDPVVQAACEILGFDPLYVANEGKLIAIVPPTIAEPVLQVMKKSTLGENAVIIGEITETPVGQVLLKTTFGSTRVLDVLTGELLPRIC